jgi:hypothetical protein
MKSYILVFLFLITCVSQDREDPLKNSKKIISSGHKSLYYNGAFEVKGTSLKLIPAFSEAEVFIAKQRLSFAKEAFSENIQKAEESVVILKEGKNLSFKVGDKISKEGEDLIAKLNETSNEQGTIVIKKSLAESYGLIGEAPKAFNETHKSVIEESKLLRKKMDEYSDELSSKDFSTTETSNLSERVIAYKKDLSDDVNKFVIGYINLDDYLIKSYQESVENLNKKSSFSDLSGDIEKFIFETNDKLSSKLKEIQIDYGKGTIQEFKEASNEIEKIDQGEWVSFAVLKAFTRATKGIFYDGLLKPFTEIGAVSVGYVGVNSIWPIAIVGGGAVKLTKVMVEVLKVGTEGTIYLIAPTARLALAGLVTNSKFIATESYKAADKSARSTANSSLFIASKVTKASGIITENSGTYILAPILAAGAFTGKTLQGAGIAISGTFSGGAVSLGTETASLTTKLTTKTADYTVSGVGTGISGIISLGFGAYYVGKAVGVPTGVTLKGGVVLSYEMIAQISAHSLLAVSDFSYLVLSMEGEKWVVYAIKDTSGKAKSLMTGAVIDLEEIKKEGNEIKKVPISEEDMEKILDKK